LDSPTPSRDRLGERWRPGRDLGGNALLQFVEGFVRIIGELKQLKVIAAVYSPNS
jgi:hypothetical protein